MTNSRSWTEDEKYKAVVLYYLHHNFKEVERQSGIPYTTLLSWRDQAWWQDMMADVIKEMRAKVRGRGHELIDLAIAAVKDRLQNGDVVIDKHNNQVRKPVALKDALLTSLTWLDKTMKIDAEEGYVKENPAMLKDILKDLEGIGKTLTAKGVEVKAETVKDVKIELIEGLPDVGSEPRQGTNEPSQG